jgi:drug/metabolite transporter (DMT)-like permease
MTRSNLVRGLAWIGLTILVWVPLFPLAKRTLPYLDAYALGSVRYLLGTALLVVLVVALEGRQALRYEGRFAAAALYGVIGITGFNLFSWIGLGYTRPEHTTLILSLQTPLTALAVWLLRGQRPRAYTLGCVLLAFAGLALVITRGAPATAFEGGELFGDLLVFGATLCWLAYTLAGAWKFTSWSPLRFTVLTCLPGTAGLLAAHAFAIALGVSSVPSAAALAGLWWQILFFSLGTVVLGVLSFNAAARRLGPLNTMLMMNLIPVGVFAVEAALGRSFAPVEVAGAAMVIGALVANNLYLRGVSTSR